MTNRPRVWRNARSEARPDARDGQVQQRTDLAQGTGLRLARKLAVLLVLALAANVVPPAALAQGVPPDPGLPGPLAVDQFDFTLGTLGATVFYPGSGGVVTPDGPYPGLVLGHGFARSRAQHANNGIFLASHGYVVVTVDFPTPLNPDFDAWAAQISAALDWMEDENGNPTSRFFGQIDIDRFGVLGHSAGGMATWVAAGQDNRIKASMPLDPVPGGGADLPALGAGLTLPAGWVGAPPSSCNASSSYRLLYPYVASAQHAQYVVSDATHCDFEDPTNFLCTLVCGSDSDARRQVWRRYAVSWLKYYLDGDADYFYYLLGSGLSGDLAAGFLTDDTALDTFPRDASAQAHPLGGAVILSWTPYPVPPLDGYDLFRRLVPEPDWQPIASTGMVGGYDDAGLPAGEYLYALRSRDTAGNGQQAAAVGPVEVACYRFDVAPAACDGQVTTLDIQAVAQAWQTGPGDPGYDPRFDTNGDQVITVVDIQRFAAQWGWPAA